MQALLQAFPPGEDHPELALVRATVDLAQGRLDQTAAYLAVAETYAETAPPERQRHLRVAVASLQLSLATRRGDLAASSNRSNSWPPRSPGSPTRTSHSATTCAPWR